MSAGTTIFVNRFFYPDHSATSQMLSDLAFHLAGKGHKVSVIASRGLYDDPAADLPAFEEKDGVAIHRVCKPQHGRGSLTGRAADYLAMYRAFAFAAWGLAEKGDRLVAKTDPPLLSVALAPVARARGAHLVNWLQDLYPEVALSLGMRALTPVAPLLVALRNASLKAADRNVVIGDLMGKRLEALGVAADGVAVIPNWSDDEAITPRPARGNPLRAEWGLKGKFVLGYSGNLGRAHEYETLLGAAEKLREAGRRDLVFLFVGGGHLMGALKSAVASRGLGDMFSFQPYQPADMLPVSLAAPDAHWLSLSPSMEGLIVPSKFYGIAAAGRPIVAVSDPQGEIGSQVTRHDCGAAIAPGDAAGLAALIDEWRRNSHEVERMGRNARAMLEGGLRRADAFRRWESLLAALGSEALAREAA